MPIDEEGLKMKEILIVGFTNFKRDPRVFRQIDYLRKLYKITAVGWSSPELEDVEFFPINSAPRSTLIRIKRALGYKFRQYEKLYWELYEFQPLLDLFSNKKFDLILANDVETLPFVYRIANGARILLDTHEYAPLHFSDQLVWRFFFQGFNKYLCDVYMKRCDKIITVTSGVAREYQKNYGVDPIVITNAVDAVDLKPTMVEKDNIRIISHGLSQPNRRLELMIFVMDFMDSRFQLDLMLLPVFPKYHKKLQSLAAKRKNVRIIPSVTREEIVPFTNDYDLSFLIFKPVTVNFKYGLGNKFFESLQARLAIVTGPSPEPQAEITNRYGCGIVVDNFDPPSIGKQLNRLTPEKIAAFKEKSHLAAMELTARKNMEQLGRIVAELVK
jgi:hypothetical protein